MSKSKPIMSKSDFKEEFGNWLLRYPNNPVKDFKDEKDQIRVMAMYYEDLKDYPIQILQNAMIEVYERTPIHFPTAPIIKQACEAFIISRQKQGQLPHPKYPPMNHGCDLEKKVIPMSGMRLLMYKLIPYEAVHVLCWGDIRPICPECGVTLPPFENPTILDYMARFPNDTELWNPAQKDTMLCDVCSKAIDGIDWVKNLYARRAAEAHR